MNYEMLRYKASNLRMNTSWKSEYMISIGISIEDPLNDTRNSEAFQIIMKLRNEIPKNFQAETDARKKFSSFAFAF